MYSILGSWNCLHTNKKWNSSPMSSLQYVHCRSFTGIPIHLPTSTGRRSFLVRKDSNVLVWYGDNCDMDELCLRNRSALAVNCWVIVYCLDVSWKEDHIHLCTTDWQTVNYYSTIHAMEMIYFYSYTQ